MPPSFYVSECLCVCVMAIVSREGNVKSIASRDQQISFQRDEEASK